MLDQLNRIRSVYPPGSRIILDFSGDPNSMLRNGDVGTIVNVKESNTLEVQWDCGFFLPVEIGQDICRKI